MYSEFSSFPAASSVMSAGIDIEGVHLTPMVGFDKLTSVFVSHIPPRVPDDQFTKAFSPFGRVVSVKPLPLRLQPGVQPRTQGLFVFVKGLFAKGEGPGKCWSNTPRFWEYF